MNFKSIATVLLIFIFMILNLKSSEMNGQHQLMKDNVPVLIELIPEFHGKTCTKNVSGMLVPFHLLQFKG